MSEEIGRVGGPKNVRDSLLISSETADRNRHEVYEFGPFRLEPAERKLSRGEKVVTLTPKVFDMLVMLVRHSGHLLEKDDLIRSLWPDSFVEEGNLSNNIFVLRKALGNDREYIETVPRRGYRFVGAVRQLPPTGRNAISGVLEGQIREVPSRQTRRGWKILFAAAAALLLFAAVFILRRFRGENSASSPDSPHLAVEQRLTSNPSDVPVNNAVVSPDGKYLAYADPTGLYLRQISSGETRPLTLPKGFVAWPYSWFPDSTHLLVRRIAAQPQDLSLPLETSLYKLSIVGGEPQGMVNNAAAGYVSPDGSRIAYLPMQNVNQVWTPNTSELWIMDSDWGQFAERSFRLASKKYGDYQSWIYPAAWSPTGQHLAYIENHLVAGPDPVEPTHSLRIIGPNGEGATVVLDDRSDRGGSLVGPGWAHSFLLP